MDQEDPSLQFFPEGKVDLYAALGLDQGPSTSQEDVKKAYKKLALKFHPDKVLSNATTRKGRTDEEKEETLRRFQQIGFSYAVLSDEKRRKRYDETGRTDELGLGEGDEDFDWNQYFKELWSGEVNKKSLDEFRKKYQNSEEEKEDILQAYRETSGSLEGIFSRVPCSEILVDEERFIKIVNSAIDQGQLEKSKKWEKTSKDEATREKLKNKARKEAKEAESYAKELGVWDDLFGEGKGNGKPNTSKKGKEKKKTKGGGGKEGEDDLAGLQALMMRKRGQRASAFDEMISKLEAKSGIKPNHLPTDEEFDAIQKNMLDRAQASKSDQANRRSAKRKSDLASPPPSSSSTRSTGAGKKRRS
ncbi:DnaJ-domain-containing protein [Violaceomyces palustris]|uniref:DnaJ-domain-containing protein n=1 Tax=Violaceomyces palustris TaxID=1673888 RepID=A0ACD0NZB8_9BASI|nr:DnaJ-domain-containing protein [Violaceomyces palustris]